MCKAYRYEPTLTVLRGFMNLYPGGNWLTLAKRVDPDVPTILLKPFTNITDWKGSFFYIQDTIIPLEYPALVNKAYKFDKKTFQR
jgi:hypothetical protein